MSKPIYVNSANPQTAVESFIADYKVDENFRPLSRLLRRYARNLVSDTVLTAAVPSAFVLANWSVAENEDEDGFVITVTTMPNKNGSDIGLVQYRVDGGDWLDTTILEANDTFEVLSGEGEFEVELRAVNSIGPATASDKKTATVAAEG